MDFGKFHQKECEPVYEPYPSDSSSAGAGGDFFVKGKPAKAPSKEEQKRRSSTSSPQLMTSSSSLLHIPFQTFGTKCHTRVQDIKKIPDTCYEVNIAKSILQQYSTCSGDNLYDHLLDIIKRVIDERPPNVVDFFEEFSRNVRDQKFHAPERFPPSAVFVETRLFRVAKKQLSSMKLPYDILGYQEETTTGLEELKSEESMRKVSIETPRRLLNLFSERVQQLQFYWNQCGFSISHDDFYLLSTAIERLQTHASIQGCRFWGVINGLRASYYIVEAVLTKESKRLRLKQMAVELREKYRMQLQNECSMPEVPPHIGPELTPGLCGWENYAQAELNQMKPKAEPIPLPRLDEIYDIPPEMIGTGLNRFTYFVVNSLTDDWIELPIVTPKQIIISRQIQKFFTGDLETEISSYPYFPGKEKHFLRAMIARITCGTTIAPVGYYRKMTKYERHLYDGDSDEEGDDEAGEDESGEEPEVEEHEELEYDILPIRNERYNVTALDNLTQSQNWVHIRPHILKQGRIVWFDELRARRQREQELERLSLAEASEENEIEADDSDDYDDTEETEYTEDTEEAELARKEHGPTMFSACNYDTCDEFTVPWIPRFTSHFTNKTERGLIMRSNIWPGSFTFTFEKVCETVYMGWGLKHVSRNLPFQHLPKINIEYPHGVEDFVEINDPNLFEEKAYRCWLNEKIKRTLEFSVYETIKEVDEDGV